MLNLKEINQEIKNLENSENTSYSICQKLAILYIVRDHLENSPSKNVESISASASPLPKSEI